MNETQEQQLSLLRRLIPAYMSGKRLTHTYGVEREIASLCALYAPEEEFLLRAAALLHDITKERTLEKQLQLCEEFGIIYTDEDKRMPKTFHARTAVEVIRRDFPEFACDTVLGAVRWHTTGHAGMTVGEKLLYLADYIEDTRTFESCVKLRRSFYDGLEKAKGESGRRRLLQNIMIESFDMTIMDLIDEDSPIHPDTVAARNSLIMEKEVRE